MIKRIEKFLSFFVNGTNFVNFVNFTTAFSPCSPIHEGNSDKSDENELAKFAHLLLLPPDKNFSHLLPQKTLLFEIGRFFLDTVKLVA